MHTLRTAALALALAGAAATAHAGIKASAVYPTYWGQNSPAPVFVPLNAAGATTLTFKLGSAGKKVLTYSAQCSVAAPEGNASAWLDLDIYVNGVVVAPTVGTSDAFCTSSGFGGGFTGFVRPSIAIPIQGIEGTNTVRIQARGNNGSAGIRLSYSALLIHD